jgi:hypothetical protein
MKDCFNREIFVNDVITYSTRRNSSIYLHVAIVNKISIGKHGNEFLNVTCVNGTESDFKNGKWNYKTYQREKMLNRKCILRCSQNLMIINGINIDELIRK